MWWGMGRGPVLLMVLVKGRTVMRNDRRGGREDVRGGRWSRRWGRGVAPGHARVSRGPTAPRERGGGGASEAIGQGLIVEEERTLVDEALDDCLVSAGGS